jgi:hypothetical protein
MTPAAAPPNDREEIIEVISFQPLAFANSNVRDTFVSKQGQFAIFLL